MIDDIINAGPAINESETRAFATLKSELEGAAERFTIVTNVRLPNGRGDFYEFDAIVVGEHLVFVIEVKGYGGRIECRRDRWFTESGTVFENPSNRISIKGKTLGSLLTNQYRSLVGKLWVQDFVYVNGPGAKLIDADYARRASFEVVGTSFDSPASLGSALRDPDRWRRSPPFSAQDRTSIVNYLRGGQPRRVDERLGKYVIVERLVATSERYERLLARDRFRGEDAERLELHVYPLDGRRSTEKELNSLFERQIGIMQSLGTTGVTARYIYDDASTWHEQDVRYIAYEWLGAYESLADAIARAGPRGLGDALRLGLAVADAVATVHDQGLIHGALEPSSLFLRSSPHADERPNIAIGRIELARPSDAGMSVSAQSTVSSAASIYASPDVLANKHPAIDDDLFSFGAILVHMLRGRPLFATPNEILRQFRLPRLVEDRSADPTELVDLIKSLLARSPLDRPRSMRDVASRLRALLATLEERRSDPARIAEYTIVRELRSGATGRTVVAKRDDLVGDVVLKISPHGSDEMIRHEFETLDALQRERVHPNVVFARDLRNLAAERLTLGVFTLLPGEDGERFRGKIAAGWLEPLCDGLFSALAFVHEHGLVHRDVKPANVMVGPDGKATLLDFGLAAAAGNDALIVGTAPYKPERLFERGTWTFADDVFAAATTIWEIATARHPWNGEAPIGAPNIDAADLGTLLAGEAKSAFAVAVRAILEDVGDHRNAATRAHERLLAALGRAERLELALPITVELAQDASIEDSLKAVSLSPKTRRALEALGATTFEDVLALDDARFVSVRAFGRGAADEIAALRRALVTRFGDVGRSAPSVIRSVAPGLAPALATDPNAQRESIDVLHLPAELAKALHARGISVVAGVAALDPQRLERDPAVGADAVAAIRAALHTYADDREAQIVDAALPPWRVATRLDFLGAMARLGADPAGMIAALEVAGGFELEPESLSTLKVGLVAAPPWTEDGLRIALEQIESNLTWPPQELTSIARDVAIPPALGDDNRAWFIERTLPHLRSATQSGGNRWYRAGQLSLADAFAYGASAATLPLPLGAFISLVEARLPELRVPAAGSAEFIDELERAGLVVLPNDHVERLDAVQQAATVEQSDVAGAEVVPLSAAARALVAATSSGGYRLVVAEPALYVTRTRALVADLEQVMPGRVRVVDLDAALIGALREAGSLDMAIRVQTARGPERGALEAIAAEPMRAILDGLLGGERNTVTIAINAGSLGLTGVSNHLGAIYDAARGGRYGLVVVCVPGDHPRDHARLNRRIPLPVQATEKPLALDDVA